MQAVVVNEVDTFLFRPKLGPRSQYHAVSLTVPFLPCFLCRWMQSWLHHASVRFLLSEWRNLSCRSDPLNIMTFELKPRSILIHLDMVWLDWRISFPFLYLRLTSWAKFASPIKEMGQKWLNVWLMYILDCLRYISFP